MSHRLQTARATPIRSHLPMSVTTARSDYSLPSKHISSPMGVAIDYVADASKKDFDVALKRLDSGLPPLVN